MGFATPHTEKVKKPRYKGCIVCQNCGAEYTPSENWYKGIDVSSGTETPRFLMERKIPYNLCPMCEK